MFYRNIKLALHNIRHDKLNFAIAILGLSVGLVSAALITSYCLYYFNFDRNVANPGEWYRLRLTTTTPEDGDTNYSGFYSETAGGMIKEIPEIKEYLVYEKSFLDVQLLCDDKPLFLGSRSYVSPSFIEHYKLKFVYGNPDTLFHYKRCLIVSHSFAKRHFGNVNPVGKVIYNKIRPAFVISGVFEDLPENLHLRCDIYQKLDYDYTKPDSAAEYLNQHHIRVRIPDPSVVPRVEKAFNALFIKNPFFGYGDSKKTVRLDPISRIHFVPGLKDDEPIASLTNVYAVMGIGFLILLAALLNFLNLVLLSWQKRYDEFAFRRAVGADRGDIFRQLVTEYGIYFILAVLMAIGLYALSADVFAGLVGLGLQPYTLDKGMLPLILAVLILMIGSITGIGSAYRFAGISISNPEQRFRHQEAGNFAIMFMQTVIGFLFIAMALIVSHQMLFIRNYDIGFNVNNTWQYKLLTLIDRDNPGYVDGRLLRARIRALPGVVKESATVFNTVADNLQDEQGKGEAPILLGDRTGTKHQMVYYAVAGPDFFTTREIKLLQGRIPASETNTEILVNRTFAEKFFPTTSPLGKSLRFDSMESSPEENPLRTIVGVVRDSWFFPMHNVMPPIFYILKPMEYDYFQITYADGKKAEMAAQLDSLFTDATRNKVFAFSSVDIPEQQKLFYKDDTTYMRLSVFFALIIALISGMGIYAVSSLHIRHQMKDIAIRKVCGAEFKDLFQLYMKNYLILLASAGATGLVAVYYLTELFLDRFALKAAYPWFMYPLTVLILGILVLVPLYFNLVKAWRADPNCYLQSE